MKIIFLDDDPTRVELAKKLVICPIIRMDAMCNAYGDDAENYLTGLDYVQDVTQNNTPWVASLDIDNALGRANGDIYHTFGNAIEQLLQECDPPRKIVIHSHNVYAVDLLKEMLEARNWWAKGITCPPIQIARFPGRINDPEAKIWKEVLS